ncbi:MULTISPECIES: DUF4249 domain-containing protein [unclassified Aureispira]|uniref:DUF4249 domain-containing protein n=1 Tax=unclassified Aureispira TaxID=2649989 RepID=UPI000698D06C|nr:MULTISPECIES: DUF4249 domain-containing protein [unclassified Aureispira]WMX15030.1 DUF4249 domain-containing protein [Aureispira sp. CCB-E]
MKFNIIISLLALYILTTSCEKIIDVDLNEANPAPVFEAYLENDSTCYVKATLTSSYYDNSTSPAITNATMTITDQAGNSETLTHKGDGIYKGNTLIGTIGNTYTLDINIDGKLYTASSTMPPLTPIDSCSVQDRGNLFGGGGIPGPPRYFVYVNYTDPGNLTNYYAIQTTYYDSVEVGFRTDYRIADDELSNGISTRSFTTFTSFEPGDTLTIELASIDQATHLYFKTLEDAIAGAGFASAAPANPTTNFSEGALGYFGAWSKDKIEFIVP